MPMAFVLIMIPTVMVYPITLTWTVIMTAYLMLLKQEARIVMEMVVWIVQELVILMAMVY